jgi:protein-S-isoprenylcysteine O-methyltransferase Ste14
MQEKNGEHPFGDAGQLILGGLFLVVWVADSFFIQWTTILAGSIPLPIRLSALAVILITAVWMVRSAHFVVSQEQRPTQVVSTGAFRFVRHPLYLASLLTYLGLTLCTASLISLALLVGIFIFYDYIASYEEALLEAKFGNGYRGYKTKTGKWIPRLGTGAKPGLIEPKER